MKTIFAESVEGRRAAGYAVPVDENAPKAADMLPAELLRKNPPRLPQCSELDVVRHFTGLSKLNYSVDANFYPLGSCTMKYNPKFSEYVCSLPGFARLHPLLAQLPRTTAYTQGALQCLYEAEQWLCEVTGMKAYTFQPMAGANGEFTGVQLIAAYHRSKGRHRTKMLIPDSAHGTNPASAALAGFETVNIESRDGMVDPEALAKAIAMALLEVAAESHRKLALIHFASREQLQLDLFLPGHYSLEDRLRAAETFLDGGTDFEAPMTAAMALLQEQSFQSADIVFITDGECSVSDSFLEELHQEQAAHHFTVTGILLDRGQIGMDFSLKEFCQKIYRTSELLEEDIVRDLIRNYER